MNVMTYIHYFLFQLKLGLKNLLIYRANYWIIVVFETVDALGLILFIEVIFSNLPDIAGWGRYDLYILFGTYYLQAALSSAFYISGVDSFSGKIVDGTIDYYLLKPISVRCLSLFSRISLNKLIPLIVPVYMIAHGISSLNIAIDAGTVLLYTGFVLLGILVSLNIVSIIMALSFWFIKINTFFGILFTILNYAQYPREIYNKPLSLAFTFLIPVILLANPAAIFLLKRDYHTLVLLQIIMIVLTAIVSKILWKLGLSKYQSVSS